MAWCNPCIPVCAESVRSIRPMTTCMPSCMPICADKIVSERQVAIKVDIVEHERVVRSLERRIDELEGRLAAAGEERHLRSSLEEHLHVLESENHRLTTDNHHMEGQLREALGRCAEMEHLQHDLAAVHDQARRLALENRDLDGELQHVVNDTRMKVDELNGKQADLLQERDLLANEVANLENELYQGAAGVRAIKSQMQVRITDLEAELNQLMETLRAKDNEVKELGCKLREKDELLEGLHSRGNDFQRLKADNITLIREAERHAEEIRALELQMRDFGRLRAENQELRLDNERLRLEAERYFKLRAEFDLLLAENERCHMRATAAPVESGRPMLGVEIKMLDDAAGNRDCVVVVHSLTPYGPAEQAGIRPGDILKDWDGVQLDSKGKFERLLDQSVPGSRVMFTVVRGKSVLDVPVTVGAGHHSRSVRRVRSDTQVDNVVQDLYRPRSRGPGGRYYD